MNTDYLQQALDAYGRKGQKHPMADKSLTWCGSAWPTRRCSAAWPSRS